MLLACVHSPSNDQFKADKEKAYLDSSLLLHPRGVFLAVALLPLLGKYALAEVVLPRRLSYGTRLEESCDSLGSLSRVLRGSSERSANPASAMARMPAALYSSLNSPHPLSSGKRREGLTFDLFYVMGFSSVVNDLGYLSRNPHSASQIPILLA